MELITMDSCGGQVIGHVEVAVVDRILISEGVNDYRKEAEELG